MGTGYCVLGGGIGTLKRKTHSTFKTQHSTLDITGARFQMSELMRGYRDVGSKMISVPDPGLNTAVCSGTLKRKAHQHSKFKVQ